MVTRAQEVFLVRHGETEWSVSGRHTGTTDLPLTDNGRALARRLRPILTRPAFWRVMASPLRRARETCALAGLSDMVAVDPNLREWEYGEYEGLTPAEIEQRRPGWMIFRDGCPGGESPEQVGARADRVISAIRNAPGHIALFAHGHVARVLTARWLGLPSAAGQHFLLDTGTVSVLGYYHQSAAVKIWNAPLQWDGGGA
jgi:broad specificity phosphatase PhoE